MPFPTIKDDGAAVTLDLHGATVTEADRLVRRCIRLASSRGRSSVKLIHGTSTFDRDPYRPTIKSLVSELLESGEFADYVNDHFAFEGHTTVSLRSSGGSGPPITITDLN
ncbi:MAG: Smr/MutS family protein [Rhodothermia bacterium]|nr:Smr/MutS family protein [Rhodothermia bacterium]